MPRVLTLHYDTIGGEPSTQVVRIVAANIVSYRPSREADPDWPGRGARIQTVDGARHCVHTTVEELDALLNEES